MNEEMNRHMNNMSRLSGGKGETARYEFATNTDDMLVKVNQMHNDLSYDLAIDSRYKRAIVYNKSAIEKAIREIVNDALKDAYKEMCSNVAEDVTQMLVNELNGIMQLQNGSIKVKSGMNNNKTVDRFSKALVKGLIKGTSKIINDIINGEDKRK